VLLATSFVPAFTNRVAADTFGSDANLFDIEFVGIGDLGNAPDISGDPNPDFPGSVAYGYRIGKYEVSEGMITIANIEGGFGITQSNRGPDKPATLVSWIEAIKFINWLNTSTSRQAAYKLSGTVYSSRGVRGGQYWQYAVFPGFMTKSYRNSINPDRYTSYLGFRVASTTLLSADYNQNGIVDGADYTVWRDSIGQFVLPATGADGNGDGIIDEGDYAFWKERFGTILDYTGTASSNAVPEPNSMSLFAMVLVFTTLNRLDRGVHNRAATTLH
jgi:hypothetical protein